MQKVCCKGSPLPPYLQGPLTTSSTRTVCRHWPRRASKVTFTLHSPRGGISPLEGSMSKGDTWLGGHSRKVRSEDAWNCRTWGWPCPTRVTPKLSPALQRAM